PFYSRSHFHPTSSTATLSLHDALPISGSPSSRRRCAARWPICRAPPPRCRRRRRACRRPPISPIHWSTRWRLPPRRPRSTCRPRSEEHTSELQSHLNLVCRLLLEKNKKQPTISDSDKHVDYSEQVQR